MKLVQRVKGTQDFLDLGLFDFIIQTFTQHISLYHFHKIATPIIEPLELFKRSLGLFTDVVGKEMFLIENKDSEIQEQLCLRPEATVPTMRAFLEVAHPFIPWKVFSYGPMFRYERPQKGRFRQFHQINCEIIGSKSVSQDAFFITMLDRYFHEKLSLNSYFLQINYLGTYEDRIQYIAVLQEYINSLEGVCATCELRKSKNILRIFDCKNEVCQTLYVKAPRVLDYLSKESQKEWERLQEELLLLSVTFSVNARLVRGLDYYNKTVFEFRSHSLGSQDAFCGGGRYDRLAQEIGSAINYPSIGAAIGIERLLLLLDPVKNQIPLVQLPAFSIIMPLDKEQNPLALLLADTMQDNGLTVDIFLEGDSLKSMMRRANKMGASHALILGEQEVQTNSIIIKNLMTGYQESVAQVNIVAYLRK